MCGLITNVKEMTHYLNIIFRVSTLQSPTDIEKSSDPKIIQLNAGVRKESFEKLFTFDFRANVFQATLRLSLYNKLMVRYCMSFHAKISICLY